MHFVKSFFRLLLISSVYWVAVFLLFVSVRYVGLEKELSFYTDDSLYLPIIAHYKHAVLIGLIISFFYAFIETLFDRLSKRIIVGVTLLLKLFIYFLLIVVVITFTSTLLEVELDRDFQIEVGWWYQDKFFWTRVLYFLIASIIFSLVRIAGDRFGRENFIKVLSGTYKRPKEEEQVLMFIDLKDSTKIAEKLGHKKYSSFIQDCFLDLNDVLSKYSAEVYQYVGDEAVINWNMRNGFRNNNCLNLFFAFHHRLIKKRNYYSDNYGFQPIFKAGLHFGKVMVAEVGSVKKDLAFHGDVINTASRIQGLCNKFNSLLLVSQTVLERLSISKTHYKLISDDIELRGKEERLKIYAIYI